MINEIINFAGEYRVANLKETVGREGSGWVGVLVRGSVVLGQVADYGNGGPISTYIQSHEEEEKLKAHAAQKCPKENEWDQPIEDFLDELVNYQYVIKKLKARGNKVMMCVAKDSGFDKYGVPEAYAEFKGPFSEENAKKARAHRPDMVILNEEFPKWQVPTVRQKK